LPQSVTHTVYDIANEIENFTTQVLYIDTVFLTQSMKQLLPLTALYAPNPDWENKIVKIEDMSKTVLENMMFESLMRCSKLRELQGERVESLNGQTWTISLNNETNMPCFETAQVMGGEVYKACITKCDVLARNGLVHELDSIILFENPETLGPMAPTPPFSAQQPNQPTFAAMPSPTPGDVLGRPSFFGPTSPAYAPQAVAGLTSAAAARTTTGYVFVVSIGVVIMGMMFI
jgi:Fasciclin domain